MPSLISLDGLRAWSEDRRGPAAHLIADRSAWDWYAPSFPCFFFNDTATTEIYTLSLHDALPIYAEIHEISGSVELAPGIGLADVVCDLVSSGSTLFMNGLQEVQTILESQAVLIKSKTLDADLQKILDQLVFRIRAVRKAKRNKYVLLNAPNDSLDKIIKLLPGMRSPTVLPLATSGWSSVHSVLNEDEFWEKIKQLRAAGAEGILVIPIEKMIV